jgi:hypothetical protein
MKCIRGKKEFFTADFLLPYHGSWCAGVEHKSVFVNKAYFSELIG